MRYLRVLSLLNWPAVAVLAACAGVLSLSAHYLAEIGDFSSLVELAERSGRTGYLSDTALDAAIKGVPAIVAAGNCRSDVIKAGGRLLLLDIDRRMAGENPAPPRQVLPFAEHYFRYALTCLPGNGDLWLRLAMIRSLSDALPEEVASLMTISQNLAPANADVIGARMLLWQRLTPAALALARGAYGQDLRIVCSEDGKALRKKMGLTCSVP